MFLVVVVSHVYFCSLHFIIRTSVTVSFDGRKRLGFGVGYHHERRYGLEVENTQTHTHIRKYNLL